MITRAAGCPSPANAPAPRACTPPLDSWVQQQVAQHAVELWSDGVSDYLAHAKRLVSDYKDVLDGADGFLLGQETLRGGFPVEAIETIVSICKQVGARAATAFAFRAVVGALAQGAAPPGSRLLDCGSSYRHRESFVNAMATCQKHRRRRCLTTTTTLTTSWTPQRR